MTRPFKVPSDEYYYYVCSICESCTELEIYYTIGHISFFPLDWDILISSSKNIKLSFSNYPCLQALEVHKYEDIENAIKIKD